MDIIARPPIVQRTHNGWGTADVLTLELKMLYPRIHSGSPEAMAARTASINSSRVGKVAGIHRRMKDDVRRAAA